MKDEDERFILHPLSLPGVSPCSLPVDTHNGGMEYQVDLEAFRGPLDLLLYLVRHNEVDVCDIPIAWIAEQFVRYMEVLQVVDVERAGEFLVMAATLMEIKSRLLLPRGDESANHEE